MIGMFLS